MDNNSRGALLIRFVFFVGGALALAWQAVWSHHLALAIGVSAIGVALTVATAMAGMTMGALWSGRLLQRRDLTHPMTIYGCLELVIALTGRIPEYLTGWIGEVDASIHNEHPWLALPFTATMLAVAIGPASLAMGATFPVIGRVARSSGWPISRLYGWNTAGAAVGTLGIAFWLIPSFGLRTASILLVACHALLAVVAVGMGSRGGSPAAGDGVALTGRTDLALKPSLRSWVALLTGVTTFILEVVWFRQLRSAWFSTADALAIMLFCFLIALAAGAALSQRLSRMGIPLGVLLGVGAMAVFVVTPILGRFDWLDTVAAPGWRQTWLRTVAGLAVIGPPVLLIGVVLPTMLDAAAGSREWAALYAINTVGAIIGANVAAWWLLPETGPVVTAWIGAGVIALAAVMMLRSVRGRVEMSCFLLAAMGLALWLHWGDRHRVIGVDRIIKGEWTLIGHDTGPDSDVSVVSFPEGKALIIDGFLATAQLADKRINYMDKMGRLPMLLHPDPRDALVICFGTGQTAHAVRDENPASLDLVDVNPAVFQMGRHFEANRGVLDDPRVRAISMDGRAWLRRNDTLYDVVTLEPMPPYFAGSNALYSVGFYETVASRLRPGGLIAQWFPLHLMPEAHAASVAAAFIAVFPDAVLWLDPDSIGKTGLADQGILIGRKGGDPDEGEPEFWKGWPGFDRSKDGEPRPISPDVARNQVALTPEMLPRFAAGAVPVTDDNLLLEYSQRPQNSKEGETGSAVWVRQIHRRLLEAQRAPGQGIQGETGMNFHFDQLKHSQPPGSGNGSAGGKGHFRPIGLSPFPRFGK